MKVLIIGGTGVLSSAIAAGAVATGCKVTILTDGKGPLSPPTGIHRHLVADRRHGSSLHAALASVAVRRWDLIVDAVCYDPDSAAALIRALGSARGQCIVISTAILYSRDAPQPIESS